MLFTAPRLTSLQSSRIPCCPPIFICSFGIYPRLVEQKFKDLLAVHGSCIVQDCPPCIVRCIDVDSRLLEQKCNYSQMTSSSCKVQGSPSSIISSVDTNPRLLKEECSYLWSPCGLLVPQTKTYCLKCLCILNWMHSMAWQ